MSSANIRRVHKGLQSGIRVLMTKQQPRQLKANVFGGLAQIRNSTSLAAGGTSKAHIHMEALQQQSVPEAVNLPSDLTRVQLDETCLKLTFRDGSVGEAPFLWLRDNCQCSDCFDTIALGRKFLMMDLSPSVKPESVEWHGDIVAVTWNDGHTGNYKASWFYDRSFTTKARQAYRNKYCMEREPWGKGLTLDTFDYEDLKKDDKILLKWLISLERKGAALVKNSPDDPDAGAALIDHVAFVKQTHYGRRSPVLVRENSNNVAFSHYKLGLHNDLTQYEQQPGLIFIQTVKQHQGKGGESLITDGLFCSDILRRRFPDAFKLLSETNVYFWDKGTANYDMESGEFYKISKHPIIGLNSDRNLEILRVNNQVRDSHLDLPPKEVNNFYEAMKLFNDILYENAYTFKMSDGEIICLDNVRCLHGREGYEESSPRHLESAYIDWDEARCRRRRLEEELSLTFS